MEVRGHLDSVLSFQHVNPWAGVQTHIVRFGHRLLYLMSSLGCPCLFLCSSGDWAQGTGLHTCWPSLVPTELTLQPRTSQLLLLSFCSALVPCAVWLSEECWESLRGEREEENAPLPLPHPLHPLQFTMADMQESSASSLPFLARQCAPVTHLRSAGSDQGRCPEPGPRQALLLGRIEPEFQGCLLFDLEGFF